MSKLSNGIALFIGGAIVGAAAALLLTPKNGEELRHEISDLADEAKKRAQGYCEQVKQEIQNCKAHLSAEPEKEA